MNKLRSLKLKIKTNISSLKHNDFGIPGSVSMSTILNRSIASDSQTPSAQDLNSISKYTFTGQDVCHDLETKLLKSLTTAESNKNYKMMLKILNIIDFVLVAGSDDFYTVFRRGNGKWKLRTLYETGSIKSELAEKLRSKISDILSMCDDSDKWSSRKTEYQSIRQEIHTPTNRHSFDAGLSPTLNKRPSFESGISPSSFKRPSFDAPRLTRPSMALSLDRIDE